MEALLTEKLRSYITVNNPDLLIKLQQDFSVTRYLEDKVWQVIPLTEQLIAEGKPIYIIEELCMDALTKDLRPSKFQYIKEVLESEFLQSYNLFLQIGVLTYEVINMIEACQKAFDGFGFSDENEDNRELKYTVIGTIAEYLEQR